MDELPLFPLDMVLFPGMPVTLHIFEPRYQKMIRACSEKHEPFGVVLIKQGRETLGPLAETHSIGCTAHIIQIEHLSMGRMNIVAIGEERFQIKSLSNELEYLCGEVEYCPIDIDIEDQKKLELTGKRLRPLVTRYLHILEDTELVIGELNMLPFDPLDLANLAAFLLQTPASQKQQLLETERASEFINNTLGIYRREVALLKTLLAADKFRKGGLWQKITAESKRGAPGLLTTPSGDPISG